MPEPASKSNVSCCNSAPDSQTATCRADLGVDAAGDVVERVHVLDLASRAQLVGAERPDRDVRVDAERSLLHLGVRDAELDDRLAQELKEALRLVGGVDVGSGHDLEQRRTAAVVVDERVLGAADATRLPTHVHRLCRVFLQMGPHDSHPELAIAEGN